MVLVDFVRGTEMDIVDRWPERERERERERGRRKRSIQKGCFRKEKHTAWSIDLVKRQGKKQGEKDSSEEQGRTSEEQR